MCLAVLSANTIFAQINTRALNDGIIGGSATIDASSNLLENSGYVYPRTDLTTFQFSGTNQKGFDGLVVYNTTAGTTPATGAGVGNQAVEKGFYYFDNPNGGGFGNPTNAGEWLPIGGAGKFVDGTNPADAVYTGGNVGIGTSTPTARLDVAGVGKFGNAQIGQVSSGFYADGVNHSMRMYPTGNLFFQDAGGTQTHMSIRNGDGNVGIGTTAPLGKFHISSTNTRGEFIVRAGENFGNSADFSAFPEESLIAGWNGSGGQGDFTFVARKLNGTRSGGVSFYGTDNAGIRTVEPMLRLVAANNRVGIGTRNPNSSLHVVGDARVTNLSGTGTRLVAASNAGVLTQFTSGTAAGQVIKWNGTAWAPAADANNTYTGSTSVTLSGTSFRRAALTGDVTAAANSNATTIANNAVTTAKIANANVTMAKIAPSGAASGQVIKWNGTAWAPAADANTVLWSTNGNSVYRTSGNVGIGTTSPSQRLQVQGNAVISGFGIVGQSLLSGGVLELGSEASGNRNTFIDFHSSDGTDYDARIIRSPGVNGRLEIVNQGTGIIRIANGATPGIYMLANDNVGIGTITPTALLSVNGTANKPGGGTWGTFSDIRTKRAVQTFNDGLEVVMQLNPITFKYNEKSGYKDLEKEYIGFSAQDVEKIAPYMVNIIDDSANSGLSDKRVLDVSAMTQILVNAIQEQQAQINKQQNEINMLKAENEKLSAKAEAIDLLQARLTSLEERLSGSPANDDAQQKTASAE